MQNPSQYLLIPWARESCEFKIYQVLLRLWFKAFEQEPEPEAGANFVGSGASFKFQNQKPEQEVFNTASTTIFCREFSIIMSRCTLIQS